MANESLTKKGTAINTNYGSTMDYLDAEIGFAGGASGPSSSSSATFDILLFNRLCDTITNNIKQIGKHAAALDRTLKTIGTRNDTDALRDSVHTVTTTTLQSISETTQALKELSVLSKIRSGSTETKEVNLKTIRLTSDFQQIVSMFTDTQKQILTKMKTVVPQRSEFLDSVDEQKQNLVEAEAAHQAQLQRQQQVQQLEFEQGLLLEREQRVQQIEGDIVDINQIMRDLATMVVEQRDNVDSIADNIDAAHGQVETGTAELQKAATYQSKYRKKLFCLLIAGVVILVVVVIILVTQLKR